MKATVGYFLQINSHSCHSLIVYDEHVKSVPTKMYRSDIIILSHISFFTTCCHIDYPKYIIILHKQEVEEKFLSFILIQYSLQNEE